MRTNVPGLSEVETASLRILYLSGAPRVSTSPDSESLGPRSHVLGVIHGLEQAGCSVESLIVGDHFPARAHQPGSEQALASSRLSLAAADVTRIVAAGAGYAAASRRLRKQPYDLVYERYGLYQGLGAAAARRGVPWVLEVNALLAEEATTSRPATSSRRMAVAAEAWALHRCDAIVAVSEALKRELVSRYSVSPSKVLVVPNGVEVERFQGRHLSAANNDRPVTIGFVGALYTWQRVDALVNAVAEASADTRLLIAGEGQESENLRRLVDERGLQTRVELLGRLAPSSVPEMLTRCDLTYAGHDAEGGAYFSPLKLWEYLAAGCPVVASRHAQSEELERTGFAVRCFDPSNSLDLPAVLQKAIDDLEELQELGLTGVPRVREVHSWHSRMNDLLRGLRNLGLVS